MGNEGREARYPSLLLPSRLCEICDPAPLLIFLNLGILSLPRLLNPYLWVDHVIETSLRVSGSGCLLFYECSVRVGRVIY
jgi:hypothetical protein